MRDGIFDGSELHIHVTGSISASLVPWWLHWFRDINPRVRVNVSVSKTALYFVTLRSLEVLADGRVWTDAWGDTAVPQDVHHGASGQSECFVIFPATLDTLMRLAGGRSDSPALMMLQLTEAPIVIADVLPGGNEVIARQLEVLEARQNVSFAPRVTGVRANGRSKMEVGFNLPGAVSVANELMRRRRS